MNAEALIAIRQHYRWRDAIVSFEEGDMIDSWYWLLLWAASEDM